MCSFDKSLSIITLDLLLDTSKGYIIKVHAAVLCVDTLINVIILEDKNIKALLNVINSSEINFRF